MKDDNMENIDKAMEEFDAMMMETPPMPKESQNMMLSKVLKRFKEMQEQKRIESENKKKLIEQNVEYDEKTLKIFDDFVNDFMTLYPDVLTRDEIYLRLKANIKQNIIFRDLEEENIGEKSMKCGFFNSKEHYVCITNNKKISEDEIRAVTFHELCHTLVENNPYDNLQHDDYEKSNFITESMITLMEEDYYEKILHKHKERVNDYIPIYARSMRSIFGEDLISEFIRKYKKLDDLIVKYTNPDSYGDSLFRMESLIEKINEIYNYLKKSKGNIDVSYENSNIELNFTKLLEEYLNNNNNNNLSDDEKMNKIMSIINIQLHPDFNEFKKIINDTIKDKKNLSKYPILEFIYDDKNIDINQIKNDFLEGNDKKAFYSFLKKYERYSSREFFNINEYEMDNNSLLYNYNRDKLIKYNNIINLYDSLFSLFKRGVLNDEDLNIINVYSNKSDEYNSEIEGEISRGKSASRRLSFLKNILNFGSETKVYKVETTNGDYYLDEDMGLINYYQKTSIDDYIISVQKSFADGEISKDMFQYILNYVNDLKNNGIYEVYSSLESIIFNKDGNDSKVTFIDGEMEEETHHYEEELYLNKIDCIKLDIKQLQNYRKI